MKKISAQYIFDGSQYHKLATIIVDEKNIVVSLEENQSQYIEKANVEFYNGVISYNKENDGDIILLNPFDFANFQRTPSTVEKLLISSIK